MAPAELSALEDASSAREKRADASLPHCAPTMGALERIYDPGVGETSPWYFNDHSFVRGQDGLWHVFAIAHAEPGDPLDERAFAHATSPSLVSDSWTKQPSPLTADESVGEQVLWAPYVLEHEGTYFMFYAAGGEDDRFPMRLATSQDLFTWSRVRKPLFEDGFDARDPYVTRVGAQWVMYYTATSLPKGGNFVVAYRLSSDLRSWGARHIAFTDPRTGTVGGFTESPVVVQRPEGYYLFLSLRNGYNSTEVFFSPDPFHFAVEPLVELATHASEVIQDLDGSWHISHCGWGAGGLYLAPLSWTCGEPLDGGI